MVTVFKIIGVLVLVAVIAICCNGWEDYHKRTTSFYNFENIEYPVVKLTFNNTDYYFMIDSGSNMSFISNRLFKKVESTPANFNMKIEGIDRIPQEVNFYNIEFLYNNMVLANTFGVKDFDLQEIEEHGGVKIDGILGSLFLDIYGGILNYKNHSLQLTK